MGNSMEGFSMDKENNGATIAQIWQLAMIRSWFENFRDERMFARGLIN